jgi:hypothetical protein
MEYSEKWCRICGLPCGMCKHDCDKTEELEEAYRIRQIYLGIIPEKPEGDIE